MTQRFRPARGLQKLTWAQVEELDRVVAELCEWSLAQGDQVELVIVIRKGHPRFVRHPLVSKPLKPTL